MRSQHFGIGAVRDGHERRRAPGEPDRNQRSAGGAGVLWACGIAGVVGLVLGLRYRVLVVIVLTWAVMLLAIGMSLSTGGTLRSGFFTALAVIAAFHGGYFGSSVARWAWAGNRDLAGSRARRWKRRRYLLGAEGQPNRPSSPL